MQDELEHLDQDLSDLSPQDWQAALANIAENNGLFQALGPRHFASFLDLGNTLLVSFESRQGIQNLSPLSQPLGFDLVKTKGWSHLCLVCDGDTWFRDEQVYAFFDQLIDDGFFEEFDRVVFYGAGPCGYAAAAFSVAAPGAVVVAIQPQATLDPRIAPWDDRFSEMRRLSFADRFGYAPAMLEAAERAFVIYDPREGLDAMHAALFQGDNTIKLRLPFMGAAVQTRLMEMEILFQVISHAGNGQLTEQEFFRLARARRNHVGFLRALLITTDRAERYYLSTLICRNITDRRNAPRFRRRLRELETAASDGVFKAPPSRNSEAGQGGA